MKLTIIVPDKAIILDGVYLNDIQQDLSWIPKDVRALQWDGQSGFIEYYPEYNLNNKVIHNLDIYSQAITDHKNELLRLEEEQKLIESSKDYWKEFRRRRDGLLINSDWTQVSDSPLSEEKKEQWKIYRQQLRDLPSIVKDPKPLALDINHPDWPIINI